MGRGELSLTIRRLHLPMFCSGRIQDEDIAACCDVDVLNAFFTMVYAPAPASGCHLEQVVLQPTVE